MASEIEKILNSFYRGDFPSGPLDFDDLLLGATTVALGKSPMDAEAYVYRNRERHWNDFLRRIENDNQQGRSPLFYIHDKGARKLAWLPSNTSIAPTVKEKHKAIRLSARPQVVKAIDSLSNREYEALGCVICDMVGATNVKLTPPGNEGGIDFFAVINSPARCHVFHGNYKPIRIIGQSKKYSDRVSVDRVKEMIETIEEVKNQNPSVEHLVPPWFRTSPGPVIGWLIAHSGAQSGAIAKARNHGIIISDSIDLAEIAVMSRKLDVALSIDDRINQLQESVTSVLKTP
jgi:hypothetical protein